MRNTLFTCSVCKDIFGNRNDLNNHVRRDHQSVVKIKFQDGRVTEVKKGANGGFKCRCGKSFKLPWSLQRHAKTCSDELRELEENEEERMLLNRNDSDVAEFMDTEDRMISIDCVGT
jgi:uncharacterized C2H2 Zn-finger protein